MRNVLPCYSVNDSKNSDVAHFVSSGDSPHAFTAKNVRFPYCSNLRGIKLCVSMVNPVRHSSFFRSVIKVVLVGAKEKMIRVYARRVVTTGTVMAHKQTFRNWTVFNLPRHPVSGEYFPIDASSSVSILGASFPNPARVGLFNFIPKPNKWISIALSRSVMMVHILHKMPGSVMDFAADVAFDFHSKMLANSKQ